jgi:hypothetical protein
MRFLQLLENPQNLFEEAGSFAGLPPKWIQHLSRSGGGKDSVTSDTIAQVNGVKQATSVIKKALSNIDDSGTENGVIGVAVFADDNPVFLVYRGYAFWNALLVDTDHTKNAEQKLSDRQRRMGLKPYIYKSINFKITELIDSLISVLDQLGYDLQNVKFTLKEFSVDTVRASIKNERTKLRFQPSEADDFRSMSNRAIRRKAAEYAIEKAESKVQELLADISVLTNGKVLDASKVINNAIIDGSIDIPVVDMKTSEKTTKSLSSLSNFLEYIKRSAEAEVGGWASRELLKRAKDGTSWIKTPQADIDRAIEYYLK